MDDKLLIIGLRNFALGHVHTASYGALLSALSSIISYLLGSFGLIFKLLFDCSTTAECGPPQRAKMGRDDRVALADELGGMSGLNSCAVTTAGAIPPNNPSFAVTCESQQPSGSLDSDGLRFGKRPHLAISNMQRGVSLIEVLITLLVLSVGLIGLAGLQMVSIQANKSAYYRSQATLLAYDMADRMRANQVQANTDVYFLNYPASSTAHEVSGNQANKDLSEWLNALAQTLPDGTAAISRDERLLSISIRWNDNRGRVKARSDAQPYTETFVYRTEI
ncbi:type IV pilus modification protein PilV [Pseudomonas marincola]|nr:type IV pilus modification protein PilV [Pseudomonas marincola]